jgi:D-tyrosyl-tRNA(Tyr) deacylase
MRVLLQRVLSASVTINDELHASIGQGLLLLVGIEHDDGPDDSLWLAAKIAKLRIFADDDGLMNRSVTETGGDLLAVSQFTLHAAVRKGNRPSFIRAARPETALPRFEQFCRDLSRECSHPVATGVFGADMKVALVNDGPVTIWIDSRSRE